MNNPNKNSLGERRKKARRREEWRCRLYFLCLCTFTACVMACVCIGIKWYRQSQVNKALQAEKKATVLNSSQTGSETEPEKIQIEPEQVKSPQILEEYRNLYEQNNDFIGWLSIEDTIIDYPVMQTPEDENQYLYLDFYGNENKNGCLVMDTDAVVGNGTAVQDYLNGTAPSTNLIIHGHTMKSGQMFGNLDLYKDEDYGKAHNLICFDSLYEHREYELLAVFYSQVYYEQDQVFKYYKFFQADTPEEFDYWYENIIEMSLYDTGVTAEFGDEFITLSCCAYHVEDGRFVVVGKRME